MTNAEKKHQTFPVSFAQQRLWFLHQLEPKSPRYNIPVVFHLNGSLDSNLLEQCLNVLVKRHEILRTTFAEDKGLPTQVVHAQTTLSLEEIDLRHLSSSDQKKQVQHWTEKTLHTPFDLTEWPLFRVTLLRCDDTEYYFVMAIHHVIFDGWSLGIFLQELGTCYEALSNQQSISLSELPIQYIDYTMWQLDQEDTWAESITTLQRRLGVEHPVIALPLDRPRPMTQKSHGARVPIVLNEEMVRSLQQLGQSQGATLFATLVTAFKILLAKLSGQHSVTVGAPVANRPEQDLLAVLGCFVNSLVLRSNINDEHNFEQLLQQVKEVTLEAMKHQDLPFERLIEALQPDRVLRHTPLFQVFFNFQATPIPTLKIPGIIASPPTLHSHHTDFDLTLYLRPSSEGLEGYLEYNKAIFDHATICRIASHFHTLLKHIVAWPKTSVAKLSLLTERERQQILVEWNETSTQESSQDLCKLLEQAAIDYPDNAAFLQAEDKLTFLALERRSNQLARVLQQQGFEQQSEQVIGVYLERSFNAVVALWAIWKVGGVYLPLNPNDPPQRLSWIVKDAKPSVILASSSFKEKLSSVESKILFLDKKPDTLTRQEETSLSSHNQPTQLAYILYTSGSTGRPKGVCVEHKQILNRLAWMWRTYPFAKDEVACHKTALGFVDSLWELLGGLKHGTPAIIIDDETVLDPRRFVEVLAQGKVTRIWLVPSLLRMIMEQNDSLQKMLPDLTFWVSSGEPLSLGLWEQFHQAMPHATLYNLYGTSEIWDATWWDPHLETHDIIEVPLGQPIDQVQVYVLDARMQPAPIGVVGELYVSGVGLGRGYLNQPDLTHERFIHASDIAQGNTLYRTGDLVKWRGDGHVLFVGRVDHQIKIRGIRVELTEIETVLIQHPAVNYAVVIVQGEEHHKRLIAVYTGEETPSQQLREFVSQQLPSAIVPAVFSWCEEFPHNTNGKIDRLQLASALSGVSLGTSIILPQTPTEKKVAAIWKTLLKLENVGIHTNFFAAGGHSLLVTQMIFQLQERLQVQLPLRSFFAAPTIAGIIDMMIQQPQQKIPRCGSLGPVKLLPAQHRLWSSQQLAPESLAPYTSFSWKLTGPLHREALVQSLLAVIERHSILRTRFVEKDGQAVQYIEPVPSTMLRTPRGHKSFSLEQGHLFQGCLDRLAEKEYHFTITTHQLVFDGASYSILVRELSEYYNAIVQERPPSLSALPLQVIDIAKWQQDTLENNFHEQRAYWEQRYKEPYRPLWQNKRIKNCQGVTTHSFDIQEVTLSQLLALAQQEETTLFSILLSALNILLSGFCQTDDILVFVPIEGRDRPEFQPLIGLFSRQIPLRTKLEPAGSYQDFLHQVHQHNQTAYAHAELPLLEIVTMLQQARLGSRQSNIFQVQFIFLNEPRATFDLTDISVEPRHPSPTQATFDWRFFLEHCEDKIQGRLETDNTLFSTTIGQDIVLAFQNILSQLTSDIERSIATLLPKHHEELEISSEAAIEKRPQHASRPKDTYELKLVLLWQELLGLSQIGIHQDFFRLGGNSLLAVRLFAQIEQHFGQQLPLSTLIKAPTIAQFSPLLRGTEQEQLTSLIPIRPTGKKTPLFLVPPAGSSVLTLTALVQHIDPEQPVYGFQPQGFADEQQPHDRIEDMASLYINEIRSVQPTGPYLIAGRCFGGLVAFEMARQLTAQQQDVPLVVLIDTLLAPRKEPMQELTTWRQKLSFGLRSPWQLALMAKERVVHEWINAHWFVRSLRNTQPDDRNLTTLTKNSIAWFRHKRIGDAHMIARALYTATEQYTGNVAYLRPRNPELFEGNGRWYWKDISSGRIEEVIVPGDHQTMTDEPHIHTLVKELQRILDEASE